MSGIGKAIGGIFGGGGGEGAAREASAAQVGETRRQFDITRQQMDPFRQAGLGALNMQLALMGLPQVGGGQTPAADAVQQAVDPRMQALAGRGGMFGSAIRRAMAARQPQQTAAALSGQAIPQFTREQAMASLTEMPGQQFLRERQQQALMRQSAALGGLGGGQVRTDLQRQAMGFAQQDLQNQLQRLAQLSGSGQQAAAALGGFGAQAAGQIGQARASGILGAQQARAQQTQQGLSTLGTIGSAFLLSDERLKEKIKNMSKADLKECFENVINMPLKIWNYFAELGLGTDKHLGPTAQEAPDMIRVKDDEVEKLNLHDELMMLAGAIQHMNNEGLLDGSS